MPLYEYTCPDGHRTERRVPYGDNEETTCDCGQVARKESVYRVNFGGYASTPVGQLDMSQDYRRFSEASQEIDYRTTRYESEGATVTAPDLFRAARHEATELAKAGVRAEDI